MARFPEQFIQRVQQATDIVELVSQYVALKNRGKEYVGLCPFHEDHKPSMYVSPVKQIFKCFACGAGGSAMQFLMLYEKMEFPEAVRTLAERAHIELPQTDLRKSPDETGFGKKELLDAVTFAARFYREQLNDSGGASALQYARRRQLTDESIRRFGLGYAPDSWDAFAQEAGRKGYTQALLLAAGLVSRRDGGAGVYDRFRNRLIFPIFDAMGRVIAFGGRALDETERAKYLNSPESMLFDKSSNLYALNWSREAIVSAGCAIIVEGYLDALVPLQSGVGNVVATLGTALTDRHVRLLSRYAREAVLVFDADVAGAAAAERALEVFLAQQIHVRVATIPSGKDPCDYCLAEGPDALKKLIDEAPDALEYVWQRRLEAYRQAGGNLADRRRLIEEFLRLVVSSSTYGAIDHIREGQLVQHIGHMLNVAPSDLQRQMRRLSRRLPRSSAKGDEPAEGTYRQESVSIPERQVLEVLLNNPDLFDAAAERIDASDFSDLVLQQIARKVWSLGMDGNFSLDSMLASEEIAVHGSLLAEMVTEGASRGNFEETLAGAIELMIYRRQRGQIEHLKQSGYDEKTLRELNDRLRQGVTEGDVRRHPKIR